MLRGRAAPVWEIGRGRGGRRASPAKAAGEGSVRAWARAAMLAARKAARETEGRGGED